MAYESERAVLAGYLETHSLKHTVQRDLILETFPDAHEHITAEEIHQRIRTKNSAIGYTTVYRTLKLLVEAGLAQERHFDDGVARYEADSGEFVIDTPHEEARKDWIGNAALHARSATVFARLIVRGEDHGVHALLVPIRSPEGDIVPGVEIEDRGAKVGLEGVDNGLIRFTGVRVPRTNLLDRFATVDEKGRYASPIPSADRRFFTMLGTLVAGRISIAAASVSAAKVGLTVALRWSTRRLQFGPSGGACLALSRLRD